MVGDWPERDMVGAARLGIPTVFARYGDTKGVTESGADHEIDDIKQEDSKVGDAVEKFMRLNPSDRRTILDVMRRLGETDRAKGKED